MYEVDVSGLNEEQSESSRTKTTEFEVFLFDLGEYLFVGFDG